MIDEQKLQQWIDNNLYRTRAAIAHTTNKNIQTQKNEYINFSGSNYLGLANHPNVIKALQKAAEKYGVGSGASQLLTGHSTAHQECEQAFAAFFGREKALLFGNGYMANLGVITALSKRSDIIYQDKFNHASLIDAGKMSDAKSIRFAHKDMENLTWRLKQQQTGHKLIVSDGVFSMHGDLANIPELIIAAKKHQALLMIDDAHAIGVLGKQGRGSLSYFNLNAQDVPILIAPFGKAIGCYGAIVAGSEKLINYLMQFARSFIYTTALPPALAVAAMTSLDIMQTENWRQQKLQALIQFFRQTAINRDLNLASSDSAIQAILVKDSLQALQLSDYLKNKGLMVMALRPPSVPRGQAMLRIVLNVMHEEKDILRLLEVIHDFFK
jgi:8-amino-7-oxononanoate synthase